MQVAATHNDKDLVRNNFPNEGWCRVGRSAARPTMLFGWGSLRFDPPYEIAETAFGKLLRTRS